MGYVVYRWEGSFNASLPSFLQWSIKSQNVIVKINCLISNSGLPLGHVPVFVMGSYAETAARFIHIIIMLYGPISTH